MTNHRSGPAHRSGGVPSGSPRRPRPGRRPPAPKPAPAHPSYETPMARDDRTPLPPTLGTAQGVLELHPKGYGFLRDPGRNYASQPGDAYVGAQFISKHGLREG